MEAQVFDVLAREFFGRLSFGNSFKNFGKLAVHLDINVRQMPYTTPSLESGHDILAFGTIGVFLSFLPHNFDGQRTR